MNIGMSVGPGRSGYRAGLGFWTTVVLKHPAGASSSSAAANAETAHAFAARRRAGRTGLTPRASPKQRGRTGRTGRFITQPPNIIGRSGKNSLA
jgi:hypothetical protein